MAKVVIQLQYPVSAVLQSYSLAVRDIRDIRDIKDRDRYSAFGINSNNLKQSETI